MRQAVICKKIDKEKVSFGKKAVSEIVNSRQNSLNCLQNSEGFGTFFYKRDRMEALQNVVQKNHTGLPDELKAGVEKLSGISLDDVKVHYNSSKPAQFQALAYTQGTEIHVARGQEKHLAHEAWHVIQQKQGRVRANVQMWGMDINDDRNLEREADIMGQKAECSGFADRFKGRYNTAEVNCLTE